MNTTDIEKLLEKYHVAATSLEEENILADFFSSEDIPRHLMKYTAQFNYYKTARDERIENPDFDDALLSKISDIQAPKLLNYWMSYRIPAVAAAFILIASAMFYIFSDSSNDAFTLADGTRVDPVISYEQTKITLSLVSKYLNVGINNIQKISKINKGYDQVEKISKIYASKDLIFKPRRKQ